MRGLLLPHFTISSSSMISDVMLLPSVYRRRIVVGEFSWSRDISWMESAEEDNAFFASKDDIT